MIISKAGAVLSFFLSSHAGAFRGLYILFLVPVSRSKPAHSSLSIFLLLPASRNKASAEISIILNAFNSVT